PFIIASFFLALLALQEIFPLRGRHVPLLGRLILNLTLSALAFLTALLVVKPSALHFVSWTSARSFGLLHLLSLPSWVELFVTFLLLDLSFYYWHLLNHRIPFLWRFHNVHHIDPELDVSTGFRFHFGEVLFSTLFRVAQVLLIGPSLAAFTLYEVIFQANTLFHHSNLRLPIGLERCLNLFLVTPRMHGIHHSQVRAETNSNYGVVFCWWDRIHRSLVLNIAQSAIEI